MFNSANNASIMCDAIYDSRFLHDGCISSNSLGMMGHICKSLIIARRPVFARKPVACCACIYPRSMAGDHGDTAAPHSIYIARPTIRTSHRRQSIAGKEGGDIYALASRPAHVGYRLVSASASSATLYIIFTVLVLEHP